MSGELAHRAATAVDRYLAVADRLLPGRITAFAVVGSAALGAYRPNRSDIDFVAVLDDAADERQREREHDYELRRLRLLHARTATQTLAASLVRGRTSFAGTCNGVFVRASEITLPTSQIQPVASHAGIQFWSGHAFGVNPVDWTVLRERGIRIRGPAPQEWGLQPETHRLRAWNLDNLETYWRPWAERAKAHPAPRLRARPRWSTAWGVLGAPRLHATVATGEVISKEAAGEYALDVFDREWHPIIEEGLAYWREEPSRWPGSGAARLASTADFVLAVVRAAADLPDLPDPPERPGL